MSQNLCAVFNELYRVSREYFQDMAYSLPFLKINMEGHFGPNATTKTETWSAGFHITKNGGMSAIPSEITSFLTAISTDVSTFHTSGSAVSGTMCWLDSLSGALIGTDGRYVLGSLQSTTRYTYGTSSAGIGTTTMPWPTSFVISLRSLLLRGPGSHGRIYYPATALAITNTTGVITSGNVASFSTGAQTLLNAINSKATAQFGTSAGVGLVSPKGTGYQSPVVQALFGQRADHMESRERNIPEAYTTKTLTVSTALFKQRDDEFRDALDELEDSRP